MWIIVYNLIVQKELFADQVYGPNQNVFQGTGQQETFFAYL